MIAKLCDLATHTGLDVGVQVPPARVCRSAAVPKAGLAGGLSEEGAREAAARVADGWYRRDQAAGTVVRHESAALDGTPIAAVSGFLTRTIMAAR